ncbi:hypothetical protein E6O75_ATG02848 [Venturia nashicola]|uniref:Major facilitator superfamily (MFS) profile domain-containing protein n=1 Tax=Venturia nashicola TaxID=86259 RepID=A0A4Z1P6A8_9PEZI|nr:hypothetical protein E6O75_ATG02848 [Venturia nashicola]
MDLKETKKSDLEHSAREGDIDIALGIIEEGQVEDAVDRRKLLWKIDLRLMPLICVTYMLQSVDKSTLGYAAVFNLRQDTGLEGNEYSWLGALFYVGYLFWEYPTNLLLQRLPVAKFMSATVILWGIILMSHAATTNFPGLAAARTFLGIFEASINPGTMLIFSMWYTRQEQPFRMGIWVGSAGLGYILAGIASFGIGHIEGSLSSWRYMFLIWGAVTTTWGIVIFFLLPDTPLKAGFLTERERMGVVERVRENETGIENKKFKKEQFIEAMCDLKTWLLFMFAVASNSPNGGLTTFQGLIIKGMGFSTLRTALIQMPSGAVQFVVCIAATYVVSQFKNARLAIMLICLIPFLAGTIGTWIIPQSIPYGRLVCLWISFAYTATWTLSMSVATANTAGHTKKITTNAALLIGYCLGNFIGPFFFITDQAPRYSLGVAMMFFCVAVQVLSIVGIWVLLWKRNRERDSMVKNGEDSVVDGVMEGFEMGLGDRTDLQNKHFRYVY